MHPLKPRLLLGLFFISLISFGQDIPSTKVISTDQLYDYLKDDIKKEVPNTEADLANYFRKAFSERFFYDYQTVPERFDLYANSFPEAKADHLDRAKDHMTKFGATTPWLLPFDYQNGGKVNAYALRHLARQHKMVDIAFSYFYDNKNPMYINYFTEQMRSLDTALHNNVYETIENGNGVYEAFRSGYRVLNWLEIHNLFLGEKTYTDKDQLTTIATLLQHGQNLYETNADFSDGNHQTKGMSSLAMLSILFRDFKGTDQWNERAMTRLGEHLSKEVNPDGFQFERSVHYHMSDIENYFYVYQLAKISNIKIDQLFETKLKSLFTSLSKISYPDKSAPVLQDDTNEPWAEKNDISGTMTLGYILFNDPTIGYFAKNEIDAQMYWFLNKSQLASLHDVKKEKPSYGSLSLPETAYYVMREGWNKNDKMMIISNGVDDKKPDHQHGDVLGIEAMANGQVILPNYQTRYSLADFEFFKNSMVKNVALVDNELQGKEWTSNEGGSGFGKFKKLPLPKTIAWESNPQFDLFVGSHNGFENVGVSYARQVIYVKNAFWIVKDNFKSDQAHTYKQVWQGHYTEDLAPNLLRSNFPDSSGLDIYQLHGVDKNQTSGSRGKEWTVVSKENQSNFNFLTVLYPYANYDDRINEENKTPDFSGWKQNKIPFNATGDQLYSLSKDQNAYLFNVKSITINNVSIDFASETDVFVEVNKEVISIYGLGIAEVVINIKGKTSIEANGVKSKSNTSLLKPGDTLVLKATAKK
jgi:hypothetical protein